MKILLMWPSGDPALDVLLDVLIKDGHEIVYWIGALESGRYAPQGTIYHDHYEAWDAKPAKALELEHIPPPSAELISSLYETESLILPMMNKHYDKAPVDKRKDIYHTMLGYWDYVFDKVKPEAIVFNTLPHSIYSNIIYDLAHARGIPTLCSDPAWVAHRLLWYRDFWKGSDELRAALKRLQSHTISPSDLGEEMREYWEENTGEKYGKEPVYFRTARDIGEGWGLAKHRMRIAQRTLRDGSFFSLALGYIRRIGKNNLKKEYARVMKEVDWNIPFVYFPLNYQPECSTSPQGGVYHQQILAVETLAAALPKGWELYIKEHPGQWWSRGKTRFSSVRYPGYYERLAQIPYTRLVPISTNTFELTKRSHAVATVTGTAGWEALLSGKCPLVFGIPWWRDCPGVLHVDSVESCRKAFEKIKNGARTTKDSVLLFLKALEEASIRGYVADPLEEEPRYTPEENMKTVASHICKLLRTT